MEQEILDKMMATTVGKGTLAWPGTSRPTCLIRAQAPGSNGDGIVVQGEQQVTGSLRAKQASFCTMRRRVANVVVAGPGGFK